MSQAPPAIKSASYPFSSYVICAAAGPFASLTTAPNAGVSSSHPSPSITVSMCGIRQAKSGAPCPAWCKVGHDIAAAREDLLPLSSISPAVTAGRPVICLCSQLNIHFSHREFPVSPLGSNWFIPTSLPGQIPRFLPGPDGPPLYPLRSCISLW